MGAADSLSRTIARATPIVSPRVRHAFGNLLVAVSFILAAIPNARHFFRSPADTIWLIGTVLMGAMSIARVAPKAAQIDLHSLLATVFPVFLLPCLLRPEMASSGPLAWFGVTLELLGISFTQVSRIYMGRRFGLLPSNRGIVSRGPFRLVRHPIYAGWFLLTVGYLASYPSPPNILITLATLPFMMWRIRLEEELLDSDPEYRHYRHLVRFRLLPGVY